LPPVLLFGLSTGHKIGLLAAAAILIAFALASSFLAPRLRPDYPGRALNVFVVASLVLFAMMIAAVEIFGVESEKAHAEAVKSETAPTHSLKISETEFKIVLPPTATLQAGTYKLLVTNTGKVPHNLYVKGPGVANAHTPDLAPGKSATLTVTFKGGNYELWCAIPGHKAAGMDAKIAVAESQAP
jgi:uncharacterized cupredoxin-like copper-binding protein